MTKEDIIEIRATPAYRAAFDTALRIHKEHEPDATHFRHCKECKCGFALLLISGLEQLLEEMRA